METSGPSVIPAFVAGLASFLSPCVLPLVPAYIGYLSGQAVATLGQERTLAERFAIFLHALAFGVGFSAVFVALGAAIGGLAQLLRSDWVRWIGGLVMVFFGLALTGLIKLPFLYTERRIQIQTRPSWGYLSSVLVGVSFAAGWTPCVGPMLGSILALGANQETLGQSVALLAVYSAGLGLPFLLVGLAVDRAGKLLQRIHRYLHAIQVAVGVLLVVFGVLLFMDWLPVLGAWLTRLGIGWDLGL
jgi:cytochrome c-type biogenesis protein